jgi:hypothetical protein
MEDKNTEEKEEIPLEILDVIARRYITTGEDIDLDLEEVSDMGIYLIVDTACSFIGGAEKEMLAYAQMGWEDKVEEVSERVYRAGKLIVSALREARKRKLPGTEIITEITILEKK